MNKHVLETIKSEEFEFSLPVISFPAVLRHVLLDRPEIYELKSALESRAITDEDLRAFVDDLLDSLERGKKFPHEIALSALALALETHRGAIADEFLSELAALDVAEMSMSVKVAQICLDNRCAEPIAVDTDLLEVFKGIPRRLCDDWIEREAA